MNITNVLRLRSSIRSIGKIDRRFLSSLRSVACEDSEENKTNEIKKGTNTSFPADAKCFQENETGEIHVGIKNSFTAGLFQGMRLKNSERESKAPSLQNCAFTRTFLPCILPSSFTQSTRAFAYKTPPTFQCLVCFFKRENETGEIHEGIKSSFTGELFQGMRLKNSERESKAPSLQNCAFTRTFLPCILPSSFVHITRAFAYKNPPTFKCLVCFSKRASREGAAHWMTFTRVRFKCIATRIILVQAKSNFSAGRLFSLTRISGNEASREGAAHWMIFTRGLAYENPKTFHCIACYLRKQSKDSSFHTKLELEDHCREKAKHEKDNNSRRVHYAKSFCTYCGNGFKKTRDRKAHEAVCYKAP